MPRYAADSRDRVRDAVDMIALVEGKVELTKHGHNSYKGLCPFHDERTPSFHVRPDEKHYHCFGCQESGDPFTFVMETEGLDFVGALESLADRFGVTLETEAEDPEAAARRAHRERLHALCERAATFYERMLWQSREGEAARTYLLEERGLDPELLRRFRVGWAPNAWDKVLIGSRAAGFSDEEMLAAGLIQVSRKDPSRRYDRFRAQITFPTADGRGRVIGFGARKLPGDEREWLGKYVNTAEGDLYSKRAVLYGIQEARGPAARLGRMVLAEGYTDVIALHQAGVTHAVGIMGTSLTREQVAELVRLVRTLVLCLDADTAGQEAMARAATLCAQTGLELRVVALPPGEDPGGLIRSAGPVALAERVEASVPYVAFAVDRILARADLGSAEGKDAAITDLAPVLAAVAPSVLGDELLARSAAALEVGESRLITLLARQPGARSRPDGPSGDPGPEPVPEWYEDGTGGGGGGRSGPPPPASAAAPRRAAGRVLSPALKTERDFLAMCLAAGEIGRAELARLDPEVQLTSALLRRVARRLQGQLEIAGGVVAMPPAGDPAGGEAEISDEQVSLTIDELERRAERARRSGREVTAGELEHARLLLELARIERALVRARQGGGGIAELAAERQAVRASIGHVLARLVTAG